MMKIDELLSMEHWLSDVHTHVSKSAPDLLPILNIYQSEAQFGRRYIDTDLAGLAKGAEVLEVGAGSLLLSCQLVREGFRVTALEPLGEGFSHFNRLRKLVLERAESLECVPHILDVCAEDISSESSFDYAFSINVMEHVNDVYAVIARVGASLKPGACYRFTCPNYLFPYEPHFNIPTLFSKKLTESFFRQKIFQKKELLDPAGVWRSLNWITVRKLKKIVNKLPSLRIEFNKLFLVSTLERIGTDKEFALRRSVLMKSLILWMVRLRLHRLAGFLPAMIQPVIDCTVIRVVQVEVI